MSLNLYFDNAATSYPKPKELEDAAISYLRRGGTYGRVSYGRAVENVRIVEECRDMLGDKFKVSADNIFFTKHATEASNLIINALKLEGKRIITSAMEHNATMRPLTASGAIIDHFESDSDGLISLEEAQKVDFSRYELVVINHISNVNGVIQPIEAIEAIIDGRCKLMVDCSQSAGGVDFTFCGDFTIFTAHKSLLGPTGVGGVYIKSPKEIEPLILGGTGSRSDSYEMPLSFPDRYEAGTPNILGIEMLKAALEHYPEPKHNREDFRELLESIESLKNIKLYKANSFENQAEVFSMRFLNFGVAKAADILYEEFGVELRRGLHCSPLAHRTIGSFPEGTLRFSLSPYHTREDLNHLLEVITTISER